MRKKSHISLAEQMVDALDLDFVFDYKLPFYIGSIWPDCRPSFVTTPHHFDVTYTQVEGRIKHLVDTFDPEQGMNMRRCARLGVIIHYIADYFTFPHNSHYEGSIKDHCMYESQLKHDLKAYLQTDEAREVQGTTHVYSSVSELTDYIREFHQQYMKTTHNVAEDIQYILRVCTTVVRSIMHMIAMQIQSAMPRVQQMIA